LSQFTGSSPLSADDARLTARLPGLNVEITHRRSLGGEAEQIVINLQAVPSFEAFARWLEAANPYALWAQGLWLAWGSALEATCALMPGLPPLAKTGSGAAGLASEEQRSSP
jgi:hypothetical protein